MLQAKFQSHRSYGSGEEDFLRAFIIYGRGSHLGHVTQTPGTNFHSPIPLRLQMKIVYNWPCSFRGEDV